MEPENTHEKFLEGLMDQCLEILGEYFDAAQILCSYVDDDGQTCRATRGKGNWYARCGMAQEFLEMDAAQTTAFELKKVLPSQDDGESGFD